MWSLICDWLPIIAFLSGTALGLLTLYSFLQEKEKHLKQSLNKIKSEKIVLENQLDQQSHLKQDLLSISHELNTTKSNYAELSNKLIKTSAELNNLANSQSKIVHSEVNDLNLENNELRQKIKKLEKSSNKSSSGNDYLSDYQKFLLNLEDSIIKAKKNAFNDKKAKKKSKKKKYLDESEFKTNKKKNQKDKISQANLDFYTEKFKGFSPENKALKLFEEPQKLEKDLTYIYGISPQIQNVLNSANIYTFEDLSNTKIETLKNILISSGDQFKNISPLNWPIQARIAEKGQWAILDEYKQKMNLIN